MKLLNFNIIAIELSRVELSWDDDLFIMPSSSNVRLAEVEWMERELGDGSLFVSSQKCNNCEIISSCNFSVNSLEFQLICDFKMM